jgi:poly-gamma-glutamate synthesis protein (capsule biosynthesis protein)
MTATKILLLGDLILDVPDADHWLSGLAPTLRAADVVIGHLEVPYTTSTEEMPGDVPRPVPIRRISMLWRGRGSRRSAWRATI